VGSDISDADATCIGLRETSTAPLAGRDSDSDDTCRGAIGCPTPSASPSVLPKWSGDPLRDATATTCAASLPCARIDDDIAEPTRNDDDTCSSPPATDAEMAVGLYIDIGVNTLVPASP
jgi:hypothetical protein